MKHIIYIALTVVSPFSFHGPASAQSVEDAASDTEVAASVDSRTLLWRGLYEGMSIDEAATLLRQIPGVTRVRVITRRGQSDQLDIDTQRTFMVSDNRAGISTKFDDDGKLSEVTITFWGSMFSQMCANELSRTFARFDDLLSTRYVEVARSRSSSVVIYGNSSVVARQYINTREALPTSPLASDVICSREGSTMGNVKILYMSSLRYTQIIEQQSQQRDDERRRDAEGL